MKFDKSKIISLIKKHVLNNLKDYLTLILVLIIGVFLGVFFVNNLAEDKNQEVSSYILDFFGKVKDSDMIDNLGILKISIINTVKTGIIIWFFGTTVIRTSNSFWDYFL